MALRSARPNAGTGCCLWFTGLSGSGKSTTAEALATLLRRRRCPVAILDGDAVRQTVSPDLGFSRRDRLTHNRRVARIAAEQVRRGHLVLCALISPYRVGRAKARAIIGPSRFLEVFVDTPLERCAQRDPKGLYARARRGELAHFTGMDDPYEPPESPTITVDTVRASAGGNAQRLYEILLQRGFLAWP